MQIACVNPGTMQLQLLAAQLVNLSQSGNHGNVITATRAILQPTVTVAVAEWLW